MVRDPEKMYEQTRREYGEVEAMRRLISTSKTYVAAFLALCVLVVAGWFGMSIYADTRVNNCRDLVEDRFWSDVGETILVYRETGTMPDELARDMRDHIGAMDTVTDICPSAFWPWDLPNVPADPAQP